MAYWPRTLFRFLEEDRRLFWMHWLPRIPLEVSAVNLRVGWFLITSRGAWHGGLFARNPLGTNNEETGSFTNDCCLFSRSLLTSRVVLTNPVSTGS